MYTLSTPPPCVDEHRWPEDSYPSPKKVPDVRRYYHFAKDLISTLKHDYGKNRATRRRVRFCLASAHRPLVVCKSDVRALPAADVKQQFYRLADEWSRETMHVSSASDMINDKRYQEIIGLGWDVVPYLLTDLQQNKRFWFPALAAITGVRPFDPSDTNSPRRMTEAWVRWGKRKGLTADQPSSPRKNIR